MGCCGSDYEHGINCSYWLSGNFCGGAKILLWGSKDSSQEDLVVPKNQESTVPAQTAKGGNIAEQVQAPDAFELQFSDESGKIEVEVKARVVVPEADGFRLKTVTSRIFTQEDYDAVNRVLLQGGKLWDRVVDENDPAHGFTKSEIEERIRILKEEKESGGILCGSVWRREGL